MEELLAAIAEKKARLDSLRPLPAEALAKIEHYYDIELTYTSNGSGWIGRIQMNVVEVSLRGLLRDGRCGERQQG